METGNTKREMMSAKAGKRAGSLIRVERCRASAAAPSAWSDALDAKAKHPETNFRSVSRLASHRPKNQMFCPSTISVLMRAHDLQLDGLNRKVESPIR
jgi:hypothetical protein